MEDDSTHSCFRCVLSCVFIVSASIAHLCLAAVAYFAVGLLALSFTLCMFCYSFCCFMSLCPALALSVIADAPGSNVLPRGKQVGSFSVIWPGSLTWFFGNDSSQRSG